MSNRDSISLVLDDGIAFTGDLPSEHQMMDEDIKCKSNWKLLRKKGATYIKPAHGIEYSL